MGDVGFSEILVILIVAILVYGKDLPAIARKVGGWYVKAKRYLLDVKDELSKQIPIDEMKADMEKAADELPDFDPYKEIVKPVEEAVKPPDPPPAAEATKSEPPVEAPADPPSGT